MTSQLLQKIVIIPGRPVAFPLGLLDATVYEASEAVQVVCTADMLGSDLIAAPHHSRCAGCVVWRWRRHLLLEGYRSQRGTISSPI